MIDITTTVIAPPWWIYLFPATVVITALWFIFGNKD